MGRGFVEFEVRGISKEIAASLKTKEEVSILLQPQGILQVLVRPDISLALSLSFKFHALRLLLVANYSHADFDV